MVCFESSKGNTRNFKIIKSMNILFLSLTFSEKGHTSFYEDFLHEFRKNGDSVYVACAREKRSNEPVGLTEHNGMKVLHVGTGNVTGNIGLIEKGISTLTIDSLFLKAINKYFKDIKFDLIMYPTPPITLVNTIAAVKKRTSAVTYLLLKDIFPQNAVDLGMMTKSGFKGLIYKMFRKKERKLYAISDFIGCMSPANVKYVLDHNPEVSKDIIEVCPNCILKPNVDPTTIDKDPSSIREKYLIPNEATIFLYGGSLGKPQGIDFLIKCLDNQKENGKAFFIVVGKGTEYGKLRRFIDESGIRNAILLDYLPKDEYQELADKCDVGLIFLDYRFTIPNFPSRLLACLTAAMPVLVATDPNCDMGQIAEDNGFGVRCMSNDVEGFAKAVDAIINADRKQMGKNAWEFFLNNYTVEKGYEIIMKHFNK